MTNAKKVRLFPIMSGFAERVDPVAFREALRCDPEEPIAPGALEWYVDEEGCLWSNDAYEGHGRTFFNLSRPASTGNGVAAGKVKVV